MVPSLVISNWVPSPFSFDATISPAKYTPSATSTHRTAFCFTERGFDSFFSKDASESYLGGRIGLFFIYSEDYEGKACLLSLVPLRKLCVVFFHKPRDLFPSLTGNGRMFLTYGLFYFFYPFELLYCPGMQFLANEAVLQIRVELFTSHSLSNAFETVVADSGKKCFWVAQYS